jgi:hypothetical protein
MDARSEAHRFENIGNASVVAAVARGIEAEKPGVSLLVDIEECFHVKTLHRGWRWHRRYEQVSHRWRIVLPWSAAGAGADSTPTTGTFSRPDATTTSGAGARGSSVASSLTDCRSGHRSCHYLLRGSHGRFYGRLWLGWLNWRNHCRRHFGHHRGVGSHSHKLEMLFARARPIDAAPTASGGPRSPAADNVWAREIRRSDDRCQYEKKDQRVHEKRRSDPFPPLFLLER